MAVGAATGMAVAPPDPLPASSTRQFNYSATFLSLISTFLVEQVKALYAGSMVLAKSTSVKISPVEEFSRTIVLSVKFTWRPPLARASPSYKIGG